MFVLNTFMLALGSTWEFFPSPALSTLLFGTTEKLFKVLSHVCWCRCLRQADSKCANTYLGRSVPLELSLEAVMMATSFSGLLRYHEKK